MNLAYSPINVCPCFFVSNMYMYIYIYIYDYLKRSLNSCPDDMHCAYFSFWLSGSEGGHVLLVCAGNDIGAEGMIPLSEALKLNGTLTSVDLEGECALWFRSLFFFQGYDLEIHPGLNQITIKKKYHILQIVRQDL